MWECAFNGTKWVESAWNSDVRHYKTLIFAWGSFCNCCCCRCSSPSSIVLSLFRSLHLQLFFFILTEDKHVCVCVSRAISAFAKEQHFFMCRAWTAAFLLPRQELHYCSYSQAIGNWLVRLMYCTNEITKIFITKSKIVCCVQQPKR